MKFFRDLFTGHGNANWELARILGAWAVVSYSALFLGVFIKGAQEIDFTAVGVGFAGVLAGVAAFIYTKDTARTAAVSQATQDEGKK